MLDAAPLYRFTVSIYRIAQEPGFPGRRPASLDVLDLLAQLLDRDLHVDRDRCHLDRGRLGAERVRLAQQLLDQELEALADLATLGEEARDLVEVRAQPRQFLRDVDADGVGGGLVEGALLRRLARDRLGRPGGLERVLPALDE